MLVYSTAVLAEPVAIVGDLSAELYVSADVEDADVFIKLVDVYPDGTACNLADSCLRLRYRDGFDQPAGLMPGEIYHVRIGGMATANYFPAGHRIRIEIAGSNFPLADRNWHAGERNDLATDGPVAHITLHHGQGHESALHFRAYTGEIAVNTPSLTPGPVAGPSQVRIASEHAASGVVSAQHRSRRRHSDRGRPGRRAGRGRGRRCRRGLAHSPAAISTGGWAIYDVADAGILWAFCCGVDT